MDERPVESLEVGAACDWPGWRVPVRVRLAVSEPHACVYLPGRPATMRGFLADRIDPEVYHQLMDAGCRRSGRVVYQPICSGCRACLPIRVPVAAFAPGKSQRRVWRRNQDLAVHIAAPAPTREKFDLYQRYQTQWHDGTMAGGWDEFLGFLYDSPVRTLEMEYRLASGELVAVGICDASARALSSVYFYFAPEHRRRGLGTFGVLREIALARELGAAWYYLGYWVEGCATMDYKAGFRPHEVLLPCGRWQRVG